MFSKLKILGGRDKFGADEPVQELIIERGQVYSIVGLTGAGKSQLIGDIEQLAQGDTISKRRIFLDGEVPPEELRFNPDKKLVAQLSQNMNFVMDMQVGEFLALHAECRGYTDINERLHEVIACANTFAGEEIRPSDLLTSLSGGQSRSLMIANVAVNSSSPIILIDEVENAGIDKLRALQTLIDHGRIVLLVTHDPLLALFGSKRIVMKNGAMQKLVERTEEEQQLAQVLKQTSVAISAIQGYIRHGYSLKMAPLNEGGWNNADSTSILEQCMPIEQKGRRVYSGSIGKTG